MPDEPQPVEAGAQAEDAAPREEPTAIETDTSKEAERAAFRRQAVVIFLVSCMCAAFLQINPGFLPTPDGGETFILNRNEGVPHGDARYHIKCAYLYRTGDIFEADENFHWTRESTWNGNFSDKEFLYHVYLIPFTLMAEDEFHWQAFITGSKMSAVVAAGLFMLAMFVAFRWLGLPRAWFWTLAAGALLGSFLTIRLVEPRSWVFGVSLAVLGWAALWKRSRPWLFALAALYVLTYTGSQLLLVMAFFLAAFRFAFKLDAEGRKAGLKHDALLVVVVAGGMLVGWLLHPNSIELVKIWWIQNFLVPYSYAGGETSGLVHSISSSLLGWHEGAQMPGVPRDMMGGELLAVPMYELWLISPIELLAPTLLPLASVLLRVRPSGKALATYIVAVGFIFLHSQNGRFVEYAVPFSILATAVWVTDLLRSVRGKALLAGLRARTATTLKVTGAFLCLAIVAQLYEASSEIGFRPRSMFLEVGVWMQENDEVKGKVIFNRRWDSFPELFLFRSDCDYIWGMDPVFTAAMADRDAERVIGFQSQDLEHWGSTPGEAVRIMRDEFGADYLFIYDVSESQWILAEMDAWVAQGVLVPAKVQREYGIGLYRLNPPNDP